MSYLEAKGYHYGDSMGAGGRTILEFSYNGALVNGSESPDLDACVPGTEPTFEPKPYSAADTWWYLARDLSHYGHSAARRYLDQLKNYSDCWKRSTGRDLSFSIIGHSEGGYQALALAAEAASRASSSESYSGLISSVVTVDGAIHPQIIPVELQTFGCFVNANLALPEDVYQAIVDVQTARTLANRQVWLAADRAWAAKRIGDAWSVGTKVATVTNKHDGCLSQDTTTNDAAKVAIFDVDYGVTGRDKHNAALQGHRPSGGNPGYPLTSFLDKGWVPDAGTVVVEAPRLLGRASVAAAEQQAGTGGLTGRVVHPDSGQPVSSGQVVASSGGDDAVYATVGDDGSFSLDGLAPGDYRLFVHSFDDGVQGTWVGGSTMSQARTFSVGTGTVQVGDVAGIAMPKATVTLAGTDGRPITDGVAVLADAKGRAVASGRTDAAGVVTMAAPSGTYNLGVASPSTESVTTTVDLTKPASVKLELDPAAVVTARSRTTRVRRCQCHRCALLGRQGGRRRLHRGGRDVHLQRARPGDLHRQALRGA